jgi:myosin heavy subunit
MSKLYLKSLSTVSVERLNLMPAKHYHYLNQSGCMEIENVDDAAQFQVLKVNLK